MGSPVSGGSKALFSEALKRLRPLVEEERRQQEREEAKIENRETCKRLRDLEREAAKFMNQYWNPDDASRDPSDHVPDSQLRRKGFSLSPPFAQIVRGHSVRFWLNVSQEAFPEVAVGDGVEIACRSDEIRVDSPFALMEPHPTQPSVLRAVWNVKGERETPATAGRVERASPGQLMRFDQHAVKEELPNAETAR
ncbi:MAG TPA: hypothetical protein VGK70_09400 [Thermoanaerobaculia bacterium]